MIDTTVLPIEPLSTFDNIFDKPKMFHFYPSRKTFYKLKENKISTINILILPKDYNCSVSSWGLSTLHH